MDLGQPPQMIRAADLSGPVVDDAGAQQDVLRGAALGIHYHPGQADGEDHTRQGP